MPFTGGFSNGFSNGFAIEEALVAPTEQDRAVAYRRQQQAREDYRLVEERRMAGSPAAAAAVRVAWEPLRRWRGWDPERRVKGEVLGEESD